MKPEEVNPAKLFTQKYSFHALYIPEAITIYPYALVQGVKRASSLTVCLRNYMYGMVTNNQVKSTT